MWGGGGVVCCSVGGGWGCGCVCFFSWVFTVGGTGGGGGGGGAWQKHVYSLKKPKVKRDVIVRKTFKVIAPLPRPLMAPGSPSPRAIFPNKKLRPLP